MNRLPYAGVRLSRNGGNLNEDNRQDRRLLLYPPSKQVGTCAASRIHSRRAITVKQFILPRRGSCLDSSLQATFDT